VAVFDACTYIALGVL